MGLRAMYLDGNASVLYLEMDETEQLDVAGIEHHLKEAFTEGSYTVFANLGMVGWTGELVYVYAVEVWRLAM